MNINKSALVLVDLENDFLSEEGVLHGAVKDSLNANETIRNLNRTLQAARKKGMKIIFTSMSFSNDYREMGERPYGILAAVKESAAFKRGSWGADIAESIDVEKDDIVIQKSTMCAFKQTELKEVLAKTGVETIVFGGLVTDLCLETSMRSAYDMGYEVISLVDCMASLNQTTHENSVAENFPLFSKPTMHSAFIAELGKA